MTQNDNGAYVKVVGYCPMGCGQTLFLGDGGHITCSLIDCPRPSAVDELLAEDEHEHIAELRRDDFTIRHPLRERLDDELLTCGIHQHLAGLEGPPVTGRYRVVHNGSKWVYQDVSS